MNQYAVTTDSELSFFFTVTGHTRSCLLLCNISKTPFFAVFCRSKTSTFLNSSSFVLYLFYIIIQDTARYGLWTEVTFHLGCAKMCIINLNEALDNTHTHTHTVSPSQSCGSACQLSFIIDNYNTPALIITRSFSVLF